jgi:hypothetical protein
MRKSYYLDSEGVLRHRVTRRKVRSDYGTHRPHPRHCRHCQMVDAYRDYAAVEIERQGGFRNESAKPRLGLIEFQAQYYREERLMAYGDAA